MPNAGSSRRQTVSLYDDVDDQLRATGAMVTERQSGWDDQQQDSLDAAQLMAALPFETRKGPRKDGVRYSSSDLIISDRRSSTAMAPQISSEPKDRGAFPNVAKAPM